MCVSLLNSQYFSVVCCKSDWSRVNANRIAIESIGKFKHWKAPEPKKKGNQINKIYKYSMINTRRLELLILKMY